MKTIDESLRIADGYNNNVKVNVAAPEHEAIVCLAAEVRRLRHQWQYYQDFCKQNGFDGITAMAVAVDKLREENERLRKDAERLDWLSHQDFDALCLCLVIDAPHSGEYYVCGDNNDDGYGSTFREAIDAARSAKITQEPAP